MTTSKVKASRTQATKYLSKEDADKARKWVLVNAEGKTLGRLASSVASMLRGKHKASFATHNDTGDFVIVINASKVRLTGKKLSDKIYKHHTGYVGGVKEISAGDLLQKDPRRVIELAVWGMIAGGPLGRKLLSKLKIYPDADHPHSAQAPKTIEIR